MLGGSKPRGAPWGLHPPPLRPHDPGYPRHGPRTGRLQVGDWSRYGHDVELLSPSPYSQLHSREHWVCAANVSRRSACLQKPPRCCVDVTRQP